MKKINVKAIFSSMQSLWSRFYLVQIFILILTVMSLFEINNKDFEQEFNVWGFFIMSTVAMLMVALFNAMLQSKLAKILLSVGILLVIAVYSFIFFDSSVEWELHQYFAILGALVLGLFVVLYLKRDTDKSFWVFAEHNARQFISILFYAAVFYGGLALAVFAIEELFNAPFNDKIYGNMAMICFQLLAPSYFLATIPPRELYYSKAVKKHQFLRILGLYILLPILGLYLFILYIYLFKIIITWQLPNGWVTGLVSILALGGYLAKFLLYPLSKNKVVAFLNQYFSVLLLPLLVLMTVGLIRRIDDYGLTVNRLYVLTFNVWLYGVSVYLILTQSKSLRWLVVSFAITLFIVSVGPWSVFAITKRVVSSDLKSLLVEQKLLVGGELVSNVENKFKLSDSIAIQIADKIEYFTFYYKMDGWQKEICAKPVFANEFELTKYLGVDAIKEGKPMRAVFASLDSKQSFNISEYSYVLSNLNTSGKNSVVYDNGDFKVWLTNNDLLTLNKKSKQKTTIHLKPILQGLSTMNDSRINQNKFLVQKTEHALLLIHLVSARHKASGEFDVIELNFSLYLK